MTVALMLLIVVSPIAVAASLRWAAHHGGALRPGPEQFQVAAPMRVHIVSEDPDGRRLRHELDAIGTRFEQAPSGAASGAPSERR